MTPLPLALSAASVAVLVALWGSPALSEPSSPFGAFNRAEQGVAPLPGSDQNPVEKELKSWLNKSLR
jgi:hypothetical protein